MGQPPAYGYYVTGWWDPKVIRKVEVVLLLIIVRHVATVILYLNIWSRFWLLPEPAVRAGYQIQPAQEVVSGSLTAPTKEI